MYPQHHRPRFIIFCMILIVPLLIAAILSHDTRAQTAVFPATNSASTTQQASPGLHQQRYNQTVVTLADPIKLVGVSATIKPPAAALPAAPQPILSGAMDHLFIDTWYGDMQYFGQLGNPQQWVNILGNVNGLETTGSLSYSLNGGSEQSLSIGSDGYRLERTGDFNVEIDYADLHPGDNALLIRASDGISESLKTVTINYTAGQTWPGDYDAVWTSSSNIQDIAQPVDGLWQIDGSSATIDSSHWGYDRLLAIGDETWTDYEVTVPVTVYGLDPSGYWGVSNGPAVGLILRWLGHSSSAGEQPNVDWDRLGGLGWFRWAPDLTEALELRGYDWRIGSSFSKVLDFNTPYIFKMSVQSIPDQPAYYRLKFWQSSDPEPLDWDLQGFSSTTSSDHGSVLLIAHHVHARFGEVTVRNLETMNLVVNMTVNGEGITIFDPDLPNFAYSERVRIYALPDSGYEFTYWSGDYTGTDNPADFRIYRDMNITTNFEPTPTSISLPLSFGWNMISSHVEPENPDMWTVFDPIIDDLVLVKNGGGLVFWPENDINQIGVWDVTEGYQLYMRSSAALGITGIQVDPTTPIELAAGWSLTAFPRDTPMPADTALASLSGQLILAKDGQGNVYWPDYGVNDIGDMEPVGGYQLYLDTPGTLIYPPND